MSKNTEQKEIRVLRKRKQESDTDLRAQKVAVSELERTAKTLAREIEKLQNRQKIELDRLNEYRNRRAEYELKLDELNEKIKNQIIKK
jgi:chromosome segregation ATPase